MIRLENIHKWFGNLEVLRGIDLNVTRGEVVVVIGPSGSGKSTLLRVINYLEPFQEGTIYLNDQPVFQHHRRRARRARLGEDYPGDSGAHRDGVPAVQSLSPHDGLAERDDGSGQRASPHER